MSVEKMSREARDDKVYVHSTFFKRKDWEILKIKIKKKKKKKKSYHLDDGLMLISQHNQILSFLF
jgi:hypothetical protein